MFPCCLEVGFAANGRATELFSRGRDLVISEIKCSSLCFFWEICNTRNDEYWSLRWLESLTTFAYGKIGPKYISERIASAKTFSFFWRFLSGCKALLHRLRHQIGNRSEAGSEKRHSEKGNNKSLFGINTGSAARKDEAYRTSWKKEIRGLRGSRARFEHFWKW